MAPRKVNIAGKELYFCPIVSPNMQGRAATSTRGTQLTSSSTMASFGVSCYNSSSSAYSFESLKATHQSGGDYALASSKTIGSGEKTFYAVYPYVSEYTASTMSVSRKTISYTVPTTYASQPDLLYAVQSDASTDKKVKLGFYHALTAVCIKVDGSLSGTITQVNLKNVYNKGTFTMAANGAGTWSVNTSSKDSYTLSGTDLATTVLSSGALLNKSGNYFLLLPQTLPSDAAIEIVCTNDVSGSTSSYKTYTIGIGNTTWAPNTTVTYVLSTQKIVPIDLSVSYPTFNGTACPFKTAYASGDKIGLYIVDSAGKIVLANYPFTYNGSKWTSSATVVDRQSKGYKYYAYYPYQSTLSGGPAVDGSVTAGVAASTFFATAITNWGNSLPVNQSSSTLTNLDLQYDGNKSTSSTGAVAFNSAVHAMGLANLTLQQKTVPTTYTYVVGTTGTDNSASNMTGSGSSETSIITPYSTYTATLTRSSASAVTATLKQQTSTAHYLLVKPNSKIVFSSTADLPLSWATLSSSSTVAANTYYSFVATTSRPGYNVAYRYNCCLKVQSFSAPYKGTYKLEAWGAGSGGSGGYAKGEIALTKSTKLYVCVGGTTGDITTSSDYVYGPDPGGKGYGIGGGGGYNGGGKGGNGYHAVGGAGGGGATHIAKTNYGVLANYSSHQGDVYIVAGGGGGWHGAAGNGGGTSGSNGHDGAGHVSYGATQNTGYAFGVGQAGYNKSAWGSGGAEGNGGGGGGWYGGYANQTGNGDGTNCGGGGGSGYLSNALTNTEMQVGVVAGATNGYSIITSYPY